MGKDIEVIQLNKVTMIDPRAQLFNVHRNPRWFLNQEEPQSTIMSFLEADQAMGHPPLGSAPQLMPQGAFTPTTTTGRSSTDRIHSADNPSPTPDGPGQDLGNEICQSPYPDSICSFATDNMMDNMRSPSMGTPNSFIGVIEPQTPDRMHFTPRERLYSTTSSRYTYSPYTPLEIEDDIGMGEDPIQSPPLLNRQPSLAMVEEVLGCSESAYDQSPLEGLSQDPVSAFSEDSYLPSYPSPTFSAHFHASSANAQAITNSQTENFFTTFSDATSEMPTEIMQYDGSPAGSNNNTPPVSRSNSSACNVDETTADAETASSSDHISTSVQSDEVPVSAPTRASFIIPTSEFFSDSLPNNSLDMQAMMNDCYESLAIPNPPNNDLKTISMEAILVPVEEEPPQPTAKEESPTSSQRPRKTAKRTRITKASSEETDAEQQIPSTSRQENVDPSWDRRERNNEACRQSRKRRKNKRMEMEQMVEKYTEENLELQKKIEVLEVECKKVKQTILANMLNNKEK